MLHIILYVIGFNSVSEFKVRHSLSWRSKEERELWDEECSIYISSWQED